MKLVHVTILAVLAVFVAHLVSGSPFAQKQTTIVTEFVRNAPAANSGELPAGWVLTGWRGKADIRLIHDGRTPCAGNGYLALNPVQSHSPCPAGIATLGQFV